MMVLELCVCSKVGHLYGESEQDIAVGEFTVKTHWGRATHIGVSKLIIIGSDNGLSPSRRLAII